MPTSATNRYAPTRKQRSITVPNVRPIDATRLRETSASSDGFASVCHAALAIMTSAKTPSVRLISKLTCRSGRNAMAGIPSPASNRIAVWARIHTRKMFAGRNTASSLAHVFPSAFQYAESASANMSIMAFTSMNRRRQRMPVGRSEGIHQLSLEKSNEKTLIPSGAQLRLNAWETRR